MNKTVSIQGFEGSFHQVAARQFYGKDTQVICCNTFKELITIAQDKKQSNGGVMAIENSIAGSILPNYNLLLKSNLKIIGEVYLQINQNLLANKGVQLADIKEVHSHPMAIQQCFGFLDKHNWKLVESEDTALSAKHIHQYKSKHAAAIASKLAAQLYNLNVLAPNIQTLRNNYTRFLILQRKNEVTEIENTNKASINFTTNHAKGALSKVLTKIADADINLSKLQSMPIPGTDFKYSFHADLEFTKRNNLQNILHELRKYTEELSVLGIYKNGKLNTSK